MKVILASGSPRRRELMEMLGIRCKVQASGAEEVVTSAEPEKVVEELSRLKCLDVAEITEGDAVVIGADTVVAFEGDRKSTRLNSSHTTVSRMPSSA